MGPPSVKVLPVAAVKSMSFPLLAFKVIGLLRVTLVGPGGLSCRSVTIEAGVTVIVPDPAAELLLKRTPPPVIVRPPEKVFAAFRLMLPELLLVSAPPVMTLSIEGDWLLLVEMVPPLAPIVMPRFAGMSTAVAVNPMVPPLRVS